MTISETSGSLTWAHVGDLHITAEHESNYRDFQSIIDSVNTHLVGSVDFCVLPGDNADDGSVDQYDLIRRALEHLKIPVHVIPGDHDRKPGHLDAFYEGLAAAPLPNATTVAGYRCLFLDVVSQGSGGPDFALGKEQLEWLRSQLQSASSQKLACVLFMHTYPADLKRDGTVLKQLLHEYRVTFVDMGHTHYNELANDGTTIFATTRSTGQIEEGPVGFSIASLNHGVVSWRFKPLRSLWPFVMITSKFSLTVEATDIAGTTAADTIVVATPGYRAPQRIAEGSDADALSAWPERHLLGTRLGPNRNGRQW
jgi:3',5'-cyclic-AMP phosphodiesterase